MARSSSVQELLSFVFAALSEAERRSEDITLLVFRVIKQSKTDRPALWRNYHELCGDTPQSRAAAHRAIGRGVKLTLDKRNYRRVKVSPAECSLIKSYMRFQPA